MLECVLIITEINSLDVEFVVSDQLILKKSFVFNRYLDVRRGDIVFVLQNIETLENYLQYF